MNIAYNKYYWEFMKVIPFFIIDKQREYYFSIWVGPIGIGWRINKLNG